jgi:hypothetical protein
MMVPFKHAVGAIILLSLIAGLVGNWLIREAKKEGFAEGQASINIPAPCPSPAASPDAAGWVKVPSLPTIPTPAQAVEACNCTAEYRRGIESGMAQGRDDWRCREVWKVPEGCISVPGWWLYDVNGDKRNWSGFACPSEQP